jgi:hypothetical protein
MGFVMPEKQIVRLRCAGDGNGARFLNAVPDNSNKVFLSNPTDPGASWVLNPIGNSQYTLFCLGGITGEDILLGSNEPRYLDGNIFTGEVYLSPNIDPPFTGTRWDVSQGPDWTTFRSLGTGGAPEAPRLLDGRLATGTVQLMNSSAFTGTRWDVQAIV